MESDDVFKLLKAFFALFRAHVETFNLSDRQAFGTVTWADDEDEDAQSFMWMVTADHSSFSRIILLCNYLAENCLVEGDKIIVSEIDLLTKLVTNGWSEDNAQRAIDELFDIEIKMVDEGEETDSFFIHF